MSVRSFLNTLDFYFGFSIGYLGIETLEDGLTYAKCLTYLNLSGCEMRDSGGVIVANAVRNNDTLKVKS